MDTELATFLFNNLTGSAVLVVVFIMTFKGWLIPASWVDRYFTISEAYETKIKAMQESHAAELAAAKAETALVRETYEKKYIEALESHAAKITELYEARLCDQQERFEFGITMLQRFQGTQDRVAAVAEQIETKLGSDGAGNV